MRTKTLLLTAALSVVAAATSMAQAVYSVNVVGYVSLTMRPGFNLVANQLVTGSGPANSLNAVLPNVPVESLVQKFANNNYSTDIFDGSGWLDNATGNPSTTTVSPGEGFFFFNPNAAAATVTLVGEVALGAGSVPIPPGFSLISSRIPQDIALSAANGFEQVPEMLYQTFNATTQTYDPTLINDGTGWLDNATGNPANAAPVVGQGFFVFNPDGVNHNWNRTFTIP